MPNSAEVSETSSFSPFCKVWRSFNNASFRAVRGRNSKSLSQSANALIDFDVHRLRRGSLRAGQSTSDGTF